MASSKLILLCALMAVLSIASAGLLDSISIKEKYQQLTPNKEGYRLYLEKPNGSKREEVRNVVNPGTPEEENTDTDSITMYTADNDGYKSRYMLKNRKLTENSLKSLAG